MRADTGGDVPGGAAPLATGAGAGQRSAPSPALEAATVVWTSVTPQTWQFTRDALGADLPSLSWEEYRSLLVAGGTAEPEPGEAGEDRLRVRHPWVGSDSVAPAVTDAALMLLHHWQEDPRPDLVGEAVGWARKLAAWSELSELWLAHLLGDGSWRTPAVVEVLAGLPPEARRASPLLSVAWAQSRAQALSGSSGERQIIGDLVADASTYHAKWRDAEEIDAMLLGASLFMLTERAAPGVEPTSALELALEAERDAAMLLERRRPAGSQPSRRAEAIFRATSAHNALARADLERAVIDADRAAMLDPCAAAWIADGVGALARELVGVPRAPRRTGARADIQHITWNRDLTHEDFAAGVLAEALAAIRRLDREACEAAMATLGQLPPGAAMWTAALFIEALMAGLWGDPASALTRHDSARAIHSLASVEQLEPLGRMLLLRARITLLDRLGASASARATALELGPAWRPLLEARSYLWAGSYETARRIAETGLYDPTMWTGDRLSLRAVRAGACLLDPVVGEAQRIEAVCDVIADCLERHTLLPIAMLPGDLRAEMLALYLANRGDRARGDDPELLAALQNVASTAGVASSPIPLTRREKTLLPLLATADTVPDIAASLHVSANTVRTQVANLRRKFGAKSRAELVRIARNSGLL